jgi:Uroporphyrinogen decarboxylase (URO-D)
MSSAATNGTMTNRERTLAVLHYGSYDRLPIVHFGYWLDTPQQWVAGGHVTQAEADGFSNSNEICERISERLGFDFGWGTGFGGNSWMRPSFESKVVKELPDGSRHELNSDGVVVVVKPDVTCIPAEIEHILTDRASWEKEYKHRFEWTDERVTDCSIRVGEKSLPWNDGGLDYLRSEPTELPRGLSCGSLYGRIRNMMGVEGTCYMQVDDPELFNEIVDICAELCYRSVKFILEAGAKFDYGHFWEDICFKSGPLVNPKFFAEKVGPHYKRITDLLTAHGIDIVSLDCDGMIDTLVPVWLENGVNTMFPIEVGTWKASIAPWREKFGKSLLGVGGMDKKVFAFDKAAVKTEVERMKPLVELGGFVPCPDHRIPPDAKWELVRYYTDLMRETFC